jgi:beta-lactamase regulating signal transducer with metallopeptidase domain
MIVMLWWMVQTAVVSALLAAVVAVVCRIPRVSPAIKHALWLLVLLKLLTPPVAFYRLPRAVHDIGSWMTPDTIHSAERRESDKSINADFAPATIEFPVEQGDSADIGLSGMAWQQTDEPIFEERNASQAPTDIEPVEIATSAPLWGSVQWLLAVWVSGAIVVVTVQLLRLIRLWQFMNHSTPAPIWLDRLVRQTSVRLGVRPPKIIVTPVLCSPLVCGLGRPRLLWPASLGDQLSRQSRETVLLHELAHLRRRDHWVAWLELAAGVIWWFNPLVWYVRHQLRENAELACDAWVVGVLPTGRRAYAQALIEVTEFVSYAAAATPAVAMGNVARRTLERRLTMILRERTAYRLPLIAATLIGVSLLVVLPGFSGGQDRPATPGLEVPKLPATPGSSDLAPIAEQPTGLIAPAAPGNESIAIGADQPSLTPVLPKPGAAVPEQAPAGEDRISQLEDRLAKLLAEVQALRGTTPPAAKGETPSDLRANEFDRAMKAKAARDVLVREALPRLSADSKARYVASAKGPRGKGGHRGYDVETLTRAKYKLGPNVANDMAMFIQAHLKNDIDVRTESDTLSVIASQEDQERIAGFIELLRDEAGPQDRKVISIQN